MTEMENLDPADIISDLLATTLMDGHRTGRRHLYIWEARGLALLTMRDRAKEINAWTADRVRAYAENRAILPGWSAETYPIGMFDIG